MSTFAISLHFSEVQVAHCAMDSVLWLLVLYGLFLPWLNSSHKYIHENTNDLKQLPVFCSGCEHSYRYALAGASRRGLQNSRVQNDRASAGVLCSPWTSECSSVDASLTVSLCTKPYFIFSYVWVVLDDLGGTFGWSPSLWEKRYLFTWISFQGETITFSVRTTPCTRRLGQGVTSCRCRNTRIISRKTGADVLPSFRKASGTDGFRGGLSFSWGQQTPLLLRTPTCPSYSVVIWPTAEGLQKELASLFSVIVVGLSIRSFVVFQTHLNSLRSGSDMLVLRLPCRDVFLHLSKELLSKSIHLFHHSTQLPNVKTPLNLEV